MRACVLQLSSIKNQEILEAYAIFPELRYVVCQEGENSLEQLSQLLLHRFGKYGKAAGKGLVVIFENQSEDETERLKQKLVQDVESWKMGGGFRYWLPWENIFCTMESVREKRDFLEAVPIEQFESGIR